MQKLLFVVSASIIAGCASAPEEAAMDWSSFIASVPGKPIQNEHEYKSKSVKQSAYKANSPGLEQVKDRFAAWCKGQLGKSSIVPSQDATARSFAQASSAWFNQVFVQFGDRYYKTAIYCADAKAQNLLAIMLIDAYAGYRGGPHEPDKWPLPNLAFYTPEQAAAFADYYNNKEKERGFAVERESQQRNERQASETRRLRTAPKIGDQTIEGVIVDLRPSLALVQYNALQRQMFGKPQTEWVPINSLSAPR